MLYRVKEKYFYEKQIEKDVDDGDGMCDAVGGNPFELWGISMDSGISVLSEEAHADMVKR